ncbi:malonyl-CoA/methylmalonyl-CoA synthetase [Sphingomonas sp. YR710]|uniref:malonate--CoA ligase n=1 Tax=Sphingomonas sp. YR710 TaxID=1882773 RepID=UPI000880AF65|nr:malonyl-CoA synthase [Sphingomonas sp. YR710]SDB99297.1 malonyl-CoA/methylmalonyl-CoA synthetase [Sphingomonas sp. YR710]
MTNHLMRHFPALRERAATPFITAGERIISYADAADQSGRIANLLIAQGVAPGDRVAVQVEKSVEMILLYLACVRAGAALLPLNTAYTLTELEYFLGDAEPAMIVCGPEREAGVKALADKLGLPAPMTLDSDGLGTLSARAGGLAPDFTDVARGPDDLAAILYTSGTTGRSKGAMLTHENLASNARTLRDYWRFTAQDVLLHALPVFHSHGLFVAINTTLVAGSSMIFLPRFDADDVFRLLPQATTMMGVPTFYTRMVGDPRLTREAAAHIRLFVSGSAPLLAETHRQFLAMTGHAILERYGMTETNMNTSNPYDGERRPGTVGFPLPGIQARICDPDGGAPCPDGTIGMIEVKGPNVFTGYWRMPEKTAAEFRSDGFFITGDLGIIDADGYVSIVGRGKDLVISGGYNIYPIEIESEIDAIDGVAESAVIGVPHPDLGEAVVAVVVRAPGTNIDGEAIIAALDGRLARFKQPRRVIFVDELPRNTMAKVQKQRLREEHKAMFAA